MRDFRAREVRARSASEGPVRARRASEGQAGRVDVLDRTVAELQAEFAIGDNELKGFRAAVRAAIRGGAVADCAHGGAADARALHTAPTRPAEPPGAQRDSRAEPPAAQRDLPWAQRDLPGARRDPRADPQHRVDTAASGAYLFIRAGGVRRYQLRRRIAERLFADIRPIVRRLVEGDLTKFVQRMHDGLETESVAIPMVGSGGAWRTLCVSSQVGCARGCVFCETAQLGLLRNLSVSEIVSQVAAAERDFAGGIRNVVFMGMGEPFDNVDNVLRAVEVLADPAGFAFAMERITLSTVGRTRGIRRLALQGWRRINLAVSLNAPNDRIRSQIMPINRLEPMGELRAALLEYPLRNCQFFMIEYVLIPGVNDAREHAAELCEFLRPLKCVVNVIPYNPRRQSPWPAPTEESVVQFIGWVESHGQMVKRRITKGRSQMAACGQLGNPALARGGVVRS